MPEYKKRDGGSGFQWNSNDNFKTSRKVRDVDNVLDIVFIHRDGRAVSVDPQVFLDKINNNSISSTAVEYTARCNDDAGEPVLIRETNRDSFINTFGGSYGSGSFHANDDGEDDEVSNWDHNFRGDFTWEAMKQSDPGLKDSDGKCTEFSLLYHRLDAMQMMFHKGYQLFDMGNFNSWKNWLAYPSSGGGYYVYVFIMYLSAENYAKVLGCFNGQRNDMQTTVDRLFSNSNGLTSRSRMTDMGNAFCSNPIPFYSYLSQGNHKMGTTIWSPNTKYKLFVQPDGNLCAYEQGDADSDNPSKCRYYWGTSTYKFHDNSISVRPVLAVQSDGNVVLYKQKSDQTRVLSLGNTMWHTNTRGSNVKLGIANNGHIFVFTGHPQTGNLNVMWSSGSTSDTHAEITKNFQWNSKCTNTKYTDNMLDNLKYKYEYCSQEYKPYRDSNCKNLFQGYTVSNDNNGQYKRSMDETVKKLCSSISSNSSREFKDFCACVNPQGDAKIIFENFKYHPKCWEQKCINNGYKLEEYGTVANQCPSKLCIQNIEMINVIQQAGSKVEMTCNIDGNKTTKRDVVNTPNKLCGEFKIRGKCLTSNSNSNILIQECLDQSDVKKKYQKFYYNPSTQEFRTSWSSASPKCLNIKGGVIANNTEINVASCDSSDAQKFLYDKDRNQIVSSKDQTKCLDLKAGEYTDGTGFQLRTCEDREEGQIFSSSECSETALQNMLYSANLTIEEETLCGAVSMDSNTANCINFSKDGLKVESCSNSLDNTKIVSLDSIDGSLRPYFDGNYCLEANQANNTVFMKMCEDVRILNETGSAGDTPARQRFFYNTNTKQIHTAENVNKCVDIKSSNGVNSLYINNCSTSNTQKFNLGNKCTPSTKTDIANSESARLEKLSKDRQAELIEKARIAEEARLTEELRLKNIKDEQTRLAAIESSRLKAIADEETRVKAEEEERVRIEKENMLKLEAEKIRLEQLANSEVIRIETERAELAKLAAEAESARLAAESKSADNRKIIMLLFLFICVIILLLSVKKISSRKINIDRNGPVSK